MVEARTDVPTRSASRYLQQLCKHWSHKFGVSFTPEHGLTEDTGRVVLVGFSQGTIMALDVLASGRLEIGGVIAFSGRLASPDPLTPPPAVPLLLVHGAADPVIPASESAVAERRLRAAGADVTRMELPGVGHAISKEGAGAALRMLTRVIGASD